MSRSERRHRAESFRCCAFNVASAGALCHELGNFDVGLRYNEVERRDRQNVSDEYKI